jgi:hypothetical protein
VAGDGGQAVVYLTHPVTSRVKIGDVEDAGRAIGTPYALHKVQSGDDGEFVCSTIPAKQGKKC